MLSLFIFVLQVIKLFLLIHRYSFKVSMELIIYFYLVNFVFIAMDDHLNPPFDTPQDDNIRKFTNSLLLPDSPIQALTPSFFNLNLEDKELLASLEHDTDETFICDNPFTTSNHLIEEMQYEDADLLSSLQQSNHQSNPLAEEDQIAVDAVDMDQEFLESLLQNGQSLKKRKSKEYHTS